MEPTPLENPFAYPRDPASVLVVDDTQSAREPLVRILRLAGYSTTSAVDGSDAFTAMEAHRPDLILLDLMMPRVDGITFLRQMRRDPRFHAIPVILITAADSTDQLDIARGLGVQGCLIKAGFTVPELLERISNILHLD